MTRNLFYKLYCKIHLIAKILLRKEKKKSFRFVNINTDNLSNLNEVEVDGPFINEIKIKQKAKIKKNLLFPTENIVAINSNKNLCNSFRKKNNLQLSFGLDFKSAPACWQKFIESSAISEGYKFSGFYFTAYLSDNINEWCLPSWIWTNAAIVRLYCKQGKIKQAENIVDSFLNNQLDCGGWIVRNDYNERGSVPVLAPNDSAYIANNAFLELYNVTNKLEYLEAAKKCGDWIMKTSRADGLVWTGYDYKNKKWMKEYTIVDIGFTSALFANLFEITNQKKYKVFLGKFVKQYVHHFYNPLKKGFCTSLNKNNQQSGGMFARGQAWALEGLIPAYRVLRTKEIETIIDETVTNLINKQSVNGGWSYNFSKPLLGQDCKGVSVIAKNLLDWHQFKPNNKIVLSVNRAYKWCIEHTSSKGKSKGGIFSFCMEGAVVHSFYTNTAFVYASSYAIELYAGLKKIANG
jgi:rhamnogalacturonyl hydrolase YesR